MFEILNANGDIDWDILWPRIEAVARPAIARLVRSWQMPDGSVDDAVQDFFLFLRADDRRVLRLFRGRTVGEFDQFIRVTARHFAEKLVRRHQSSRRREQAALERCPEPIRHGPTERDYARITEELHSVTRFEDLPKLRAIADSGSDFAQRNNDGPAPPDEVPERTLRRWRREIFDKYRAKLDFNTRILLFFPKFVAGKTGDSALLSV